MTIHHLLIQWLLLCMVVVGATVFEFSGDSFTNMDVHDGKIYVGAKNNIHVLNAADLSEVEEKVITCTGDKCNNLNKILLVNKKLEQLITCGTGHDGVCEIRNLTDIGKILSTSLSSSYGLANYLVVSTAENRPACFVVMTDTGNLYTGVTYGPGVEKFSGNNFNSYGYYQGYHNLAADDFARETALGLKPFEDQTGSVNVEEYLVYFKAGFQHNGFVYFVTNQKFKVGNSSYISKIIRVCQNDTEFMSYTDIEIECISDGTVYNLIQDVSFFEPGEELKDIVNNSKKIMAATFAVGTGPEHPGKKSAICLYTVEEINRMIMVAKKDFITCPMERMDSKYLPDSRTQCYNTTKSGPYDETTFMCNKNWGSYTFIIGDENSKLSKSPVYTTSSEDHGNLDKIQGTNTGRYTELHVGTSLGTLYKLNVYSNTADVYEIKTVDEGHPITGIHVEADGKTEYIMSSRKIVRYETTSCSVYESCQSVMEAKNPLCGWCVYESKSTFKENSTCPYQSYSGHWLSSLTRCLSLDVQPGGVPINVVGRVTVTIKDELPDKLDGDHDGDLDVYRCIFKTVNAEDFSGLKPDNTCKTPPIPAHTNGTVRLYVNHNGKEILLAETKFLFYDCAHYTSCGDCTGDDRANCSWEAYNTKCISTNSATSEAIQKKEECPMFQDKTDIHYLPSGVAKELIFNVTNLVNSTETKYHCKLNDNKIVDATKVSDTQIKCNLSETSQNETVNYKLEILYGTSMLDESNTVVVYNCQKLGIDCSVCGSLKHNNSAFECDWCSGACNYSTESCRPEACNAPKVYSVIPNTAGVNGNITVTIRGKELGSLYEEVQNITLADVPCKPKNDSFIPSFQVTCTAGSSGSVKSGNVVVTVKSKTSTAENVTFSYKKPEIEGITATGGPRKGGTRLTITGTDLGVGRRNVQVFVINNQQQRHECSNVKFNPPIVALEVDTSHINFEITCETPGADDDGVVNLENLDVVFDGATTVQKNINFTYLPNPVIAGIIPFPPKGIASGGNRLTITGTNLENAHEGYVTNTGNNKEIPCTVNSPTEMICKVPELTKTQLDELNSKVNSTSSKGSRKKRDTDSAGRIAVEIIIHLDGVEKSFSIWYYSDPAFDSFEDKKKVKLFESDQQKLTIKGKNLNLVAEMGDVMVTVGVDNCNVIELKENNLTCLAPTNQPASTVGTELPEVNVSIGNVRANVGYLQYVESQNEVAKMWIIIAAVIGSLLAVAMIVVAAVLMKYKQKSKNMRDYQRHVEEQEMEIKQIFREEFADMHTSMLVVNNNLIETGCPYHHYQQYVFNIMFPTDTLESHPLLQEPVVTDTMRSKMRRGMEEFESLIFNKYFLMSVIYSMEKQRKFGLKDKANMCGYICSILLGRMEYLQEILVDLLGNLVQESAGKKNQKVLFRRCETVTEKLLSNWLSLCLYPHIKSQSGCPLYLLYKATQLHMEAGPIDAVTNDAKYTLSEEKLLKKYSHQSKQGSDEATFEAKCLTLNVVVDNCRDIKVCRVLDCDTITQVKEKCLTQIYVNYPASNLTVNPAELELEWHAGASGSLRLRDEDNTSKRNGRWVRKNTLAHYNVQDGSNMALIDPQVADESHEQDYVNLAQVQLACPSDSSMDSTDAATAILVEPVDRDVRYWHMVKPEEGTLAPGKSSVIAELYLNRLLTFKQSILDYVRAMYDTVLKEDSLPPHVEYLYHLLDDLADRNRVEGDILHAWKSMSYPVRIWATLMKKPSIVFDIKSPPYVETSMDVISQVFIECFSLESHKLSKDSPTNKLIFNNDMTQYKERVKQFYKQVSVKESQPDNLRKYLEEVNRLQQQHISFNKMSALYKLYQQIEPYIIEVIDDLSTNREACKLHLDKKLEQINGLMEED